MQAPARMPRRAAICTLEHQKLYTGPPSFRAKTKVKWEKARERGAPGELCGVDRGRSVEEDEEAGEDPGAMSGVERATDRGKNI